MQRPSRENSSSVDNSPLDGKSSIDTYITRIIDVHLPEITIENILLSHHIKSRVFGDLHQALGLPEECEGSHKIATLLSQWLAALLVEIYEPNRVGRIVIRSVSIPNSKNDPNNRNHINEAHIVDQWLHSDYIAYPTSKYVKNWFFSFEEYSMFFRLCSNEPRRAGKNVSKKFFFPANCVKFVELREDTKQIIFNFDFRHLNSEEISQYRGKYINSTKKIRLKVLKMLDDWIPTCSILGKWKPSKYDTFRKLVADQYNYYSSGQKGLIYLFPRIGNTLLSHLSQFIDSLLLSSISSNPSISSFSLRSFSQFRADIEIFRNIATEFIEIVSNLENLKLQIFEKPKFKFQSHYLFSHGQFPSSIPLSSDTEKSLILDQRQIWVDTVDESIKGISPRNWIDTKSFSSPEYHAILKYMYEKSPNITGLCIKSENYHAMKFLYPSLRESVQTIYIDPPYNTGNQDFIYSDQVERVNWLTFMDQRLSLALSFLTPTGLFFSSIDDNELTPYSLVVDKIFPVKLDNIVWHKKTQPSYLSKELITVTEYILAAKNTPNPVPMMGSFGNPNKLTELINIGNKVTQRTLPKEHLIIQNGWTGELIGESTIYGRGKLQIKLKNGPIAVTNGKPDHDLVLEGRFKWLQSRLDQEIDKGGVVHIKSIKTLRPTIARHYDSPIIKAPTTLLSKKVNEIPTNTDANRELKDLFGVSPFDYSKPTELLKFLIRASTYNNKQAKILDFFAGSGTTGHAVFSLNSDDGGHRQFILIEKESLFDTVLLPRMKKLMHSKDWKMGAPGKSPGYEGIIEYFSLEQYGDVFLNLHSMPSLARNHEPNPYRDPLPDFIALHPLHDDFPTLEEVEYHLQYKLQWKNQIGSLQIQPSTFKHYFHYWLIKDENGILIRRRVNLIDSFNMMIGLWNITVRVHTNYSSPVYVIRGEISLSQNEGTPFHALIVWREITKNSQASDQFLMNFISEIITKENIDIIYSNGRKIHPDARLIAPSMNIFINRNFPGL
ncbi:MAG: site-specific DNA-methyltransferase [Promethearchaeota archaeon]